MDTNLMKGSPGPRLRIVNILPNGDQIEGPGTLLIAIIKIVNDGLSCIH